MYGTMKQQIKRLSKQEYHILRYLCRIAKNLTNQATYLMRQYYYPTQEILSYPQVYHALKDSPNYRLLNSNMAQQILMRVHASFQSFHALDRLAKAGKYPQKAVRLPDYLPKDGYTSLVIGFIRLQGNQLLLPYSNTFRKHHPRISFTIPPPLMERQIKEIRILPKAHARFFEIHYTYEVAEEQRKLNDQHALAIDLGIDNLVTAVTSEGRSFIVDGRRLKSINQGYNKENARLQSIKDKQQYGKEPTQRQQLLAYRRSRQVKDYLSKTARYVIDYCLQHDIGTVVMGYHPDFQRSTKLGKRFNQHFVFLPFGQLRRKLKQLCERYGLQYVEQEESYTSVASFFDQDDFPAYGKKKPSELLFSGKRVTRGVYQRDNGQEIHADVHGALNILRKSNVVSLNGLYARGDVDTPVRIRVA